MNRKVTTAIAISIAAAGTIIAMAVPATASPPVPRLTTQVVTATAAPFPTGSTATATCPAGTSITGGGYNAGGAAGTAVGESFPDGNGWTAVMTGGPSGAVLTVYAVCGAIG
jgi:hypothetical protein